MNILLLYPEFPDTFWSLKHAIKFVKKRAALPPLGLLTVAPMLPSSWSKRLVDLNVAKLTQEDLSWASYAFISAMGIQRKSALEVIARCKEAGVKVVAGGPLFVNEHEQFYGVDHFVLNEAEITLKPFLADLEAGSPKRVYSTTEFCDMTQTPPPDWSFAGFRHYASLSIQFSRGCPFDCEFCNITALLGRRHRIKTSAQIIFELDLMYSLGWRGPVFFVDDNFIGSRHYLKSTLLPELIQWRCGKKGMPFNTEVSINLADDPELMKMMSEAGFTSVFIGIETPEEEGLSECNKKQNKNRNLMESVRRLQKNGLQVQAGFIVGFDSDTTSIFQAQREFIQRSGIVTAMVGLLQAPQGTKLYDRLKKEGRLIGAMTGDNLDGTTNIIPRMDLEILMAGYRSLVGSIYSPKNYYRRVKTFLSEYKAPTVDEPLNFQRFLAFFRSLFKLGILGRERFQYWRLMLWSLFKRPGSFPLAITFAIYGHHFRKVFERTVCRSGVWER
jgi:radical SAM superfamily enzyme YgiQ (UPF0313 family)